MPPTWLVLCGVVAVQVGFGVYPVVVRKYASGDAVKVPLVIPFYQDLGCCPLVFLSALIAERRLLVPGPKMLLVLASLGLLGMFASHLLYILGVFWAGPNPASAIQPIIPVWTVVLAVVTCTERVPSPLHLHAYVKLVGILMAAGGAVELILTADHSSHTPLNGTNATTLPPPPSQHHHPVSLQLAGYACLFGNTLCIALCVLIQKRFIFNSETSEWRAHPIYVTAYSYLFGVLGMALASTYYFATGRAGAYAVGGTTIYVVIYAVFITSGTCSMLLAWTNLHLSSTVVTAFWPLQVLVSAVMAYFLTGDRFAPYQYIGAVMLVVALFLVLFSNHMEERLRDGKSVLRVDCHMTNPPSPMSAVPDNETTDERSMLISPQTPHLN